MINPPAGTVPQVPVGVPGIVERVRGERRRVDAPCAQQCRPRERPDAADRPERHPVQYTGCSKQDSGCSYVVSTGILLFDVDSNAIERHLNTFRDNDVNVLNAQ
jgi:hypothetical protein